MKAARRILNEPRVNPRKMSRQLKTRCESEKMYRRVLVDRMSTWKEARPSRSKDRVKKQWFNSDQWVWKDNYGPTFIHDYEWRPNDSKWHDDQANDKGQAASKPICESRSRMKRKRQHRSRNVNEDKDWKGRISILVEIPKINKFHMNELNSKIWS